MNLRRRITGPTLTSQNQWETVSSIPQTRLSMSYEMGAEAAYQLSSNSQLFVSPKVRFSTSSQDVQELGFSIRRRIIGLDLGLRSLF